MACHERSAALLAAASRLEAGGGESKAQLTRPSALTIITIEQFERVRKQLAANKTYTHKHQVQRFALLRRMVRCGHCGSRVQPTWAKNHGREYRYYVCAKRVITGYDKCPLPTLPAGQIETAVVDQLRMLLRHPDVIARTYREICKSGQAAPDAESLARLDKSRKRHEQTQKSIRTLLNVCDQDEDFLAEELKRLNGELKSSARNIRDLEFQVSKSQPVELNRVSEALRSIDPVWDVLFPEEQRRIARLLVEKIIVSTSGIDIRFRTNGIEQIVEELRSPFDAEENGGRHGDLSRRSCGAKAEAASAAKRGPTRRSRASNYAPASQPIEERIHA